MSNTAMIDTEFACHSCGKISYGEIIDHYFKLQLHCPYCTAFIRYTSISECTDFIFYQYGSKWNGEWVSDIAVTEEGRKFLEGRLEYRQNLKDWQRYVIDLYL